MVALLYYEVDDVILWSLFGMLYNVTYAKDINILAPVDVQLSIFTEGP